MSRDHWILDENRKLIKTDLITWGKWLQTCKDRIVKQEMVGDSKVSTVFLGIDHNFNDGPPILWETMVFGGKLDQEQDRCSGNWEQAEAMHQQMVAKVKHNQPTEELE